MLPGTPANERVCACFLAPPAPCGKTARDAAWHPCHAHACTARDARGARSCLPCRVRARAQAHEILSEPGPQPKLTGPAAPVPQAASSKGNGNDQGGKTAAPPDKFGRGGQARGQLGGQEGATGGTSFTQDENELLTEALMEHSQ